MDYGPNATFGVPLYTAWKDLLSTATEQIDIASFYWSLTGEDIGVKSSTDQFVSSDLAIYCQSQTGQIELLEIEFIIVALSAEQLWN